GLWTAPALAPPFIESGSRHERAPMAHGRAKTRFIRCGFTTGIDKKRHLLRVLRPGRQKPPAHKQRAPVRHVRTGRAPPPRCNHQDWLGRRNVEAWRKILDVDD